MNWLAKINLSVVVQRLGPFRSALLLISLIAVSFFSGYRIGNYYNNYQVKTIENQAARLTSLYDIQQQQASRINTLLVELEVERLASEQAASALKALQAEHFAVKKELAFYEKVMAPEKQADGLVIDSVAIVPTQSENHYRYQVVLVQQQANKRYAKGYIELSLKGSQAKKPAQINLAELANIDQKARSFSLQYFQILEGEFTLPEEFSPEQLDVSVILPKGKWQKYQRIDQSYDWQQINSGL
ncbi:hypothetical protein LP316_05305 [Thalassotalea sp. LPB0316]|uniref:DUF6776 family protein n=1 Tax=Thalassotalea sp. LPB0316 TaxID=2769490 RepID=UPI0018677647|nr:DUF6776 family protein [Thalassotalea sp. LPB0316]QOL26718.1 hypothetical protein LP316_05305 [Thalassotalea sp. LPB0316]